MGHNLNYNEHLGRHAFFSRKEKAWHGLGVIVEHALTSEEAIVAAGLDYTVAKGATYVKYDTPISGIKGKVLPNVFGTYRTDTGDVLGAVGKQYEVIQNKDAFSFFDNIVSSKEAIFETAGALGKGETIFITAKLPSYIQLENNDLIDKYLLLTSSHDGSRAISAMITPVRVVCNNTLNVALSNNTNRIYIKHTKSAHEKLKIGAELMGLTNKYFETFQDVLNKLKSEPITEPEISLILETNILSPKEIEEGNISFTKHNMIVDIMDNIESGIGQELYRGTKLWVFNGVSTYINNAAKYKNNEDKFQSITNGKSAKLLNNILIDLMQ